MKHKITFKQTIPADADVVWEFFSRPENLKRLTPAYMQMTVKQELPDQVYNGLLITYSLKPLLGIPMTWVTELKHIEKGVRFVDEQREGPYSFWYHIHTFEQTDEGIAMTDEVYYELPLGCLGELAHILFVKKQLQGIFFYRFQEINKIFPKR